MRTWTPPLLLLATLVMLAWKPRSSLKLIGYVLMMSMLLAASTAIAGWLMWQALLYLIHQT
jgi:hypothetical protein